MDIIKGAHTRHQGTRQQAANTTLRKQQRSISTAQNNVEYNFGSLFEPLTSVKSCPRLFDGSKELPVMLRGENIATLPFFEPFKG